MIRYSAYRAALLVAGLAVATSVMAQQTPTNPTPTPSVSSGVQGMIMQQAPSSTGGAESGAFRTGRGAASSAPSAPSAPQGGQGSAVQTIRSSARRQVSVAGQQAFEPILQHAVTTSPLPDVGDPITIAASEAAKPIIEVLDQVAMASGWNVIASEGVEEEKIRFWVKQVKPKEVMEALRFKGIYYDYDAATNFLYVMLDGEFLEREYGAQQHAEFRIQNADVVDMEAILSALMSETGKLISDPRTGKIFVWDTQANIEAMEDAVSELDVPLEPKVFALKHLSAEDLLDTIESLLSERGLAQADPRTNSIVVTDLPARQQQIGVMLEALDQKLETRTWTLNYADPESLSERLETILPEELGTVTVDEDTYQVSVTAIPSRIEEIDEIIKSWDVKGRQVQIEAYLVTASTNVMRDLSINWAYFDEIGGVPFALQSGNSQPDYTGGPESGQRGSVGRRPYRAYLRDPITGSLIEQLSNEGGGEAGTATGNYILDPEFKGNRVAAVLDYLDSTGEVNILSRPRVTVQDGEEATFENTTDRPFQSIGYSNYGGVVLNNNNTQQSISSRVIPGSVQFITVGTVLKVKPRISDDNNILMEIEAEDSTAEDKTILSADLASTIPQKTQNKAETQVLVNDGQTIVIGGLRSLSLQDDLEKFPILGDLPFIGRLFRTTSKEHKDRELAVFITPTIVDENTQPEAERLAKFEEDATDTMRHSKKSVWGRTVDRLTQGKNERSIAVGQSGDIYSEGKLVSVDGLNKEFEALRDAPVKPTIILRVHPSSPPSVAASIRAAAEAAGLKVSEDRSRSPFVPSFQKDVPPLVPTEKEAAAIPEVKPKAEAKPKSEEKPKTEEKTSAKTPPSKAETSAPAKPENKPPEPPEQKPVAVPSVPPPPEPVLPPQPQTGAVPPGAAPPQSIPQPFMPPAQSPTAGPAEIPPLTDKSAYTVQVSSFGAANTKVASAYKAEIEKKTGYPLSLITSDDGKLILAYIGGFSDRKSANLARESMGQLPYFSDCFVKQLNQ